MIVLSEALGDLNVIFIVYALSIFLTHDGSFLCVSDVFLSALSPYLAGLHLDISQED